MDSLTHLMVGHAMGALATTVLPAAGPPVYWAALVGNSLPDLDVPVSLLLRRGVKLHRTFTHTLPGAALLSAVSALVLGRIFPEADLALLFAWTLLGCLVHLALDCLNLFGVRPFWPIVDRPVELGVLHITDPLLLFLLSAPSMGACLSWFSPGMASLGFLAIWPYVGYRLRVARRLLRRLRAEGSLRARVVPWFSGWRYIFETDRAVEFGLWSRGRRVPLHTFPKHRDPRIDATRSDPRVARFLQSAEYPVALLQGDAVVWIDALRRLRADFRPLRIPVGS